MPTRARTATPRSGSELCQSFSNSFKARLTLAWEFHIQGGYGSIFRAFRRSDDGISQRTNPAHTDLHHISRSQGADTGGRAGGNGIASLERHHLRDVANYNIKRKNHFRGVAVLFPDSIHESLDGDAGWIE